MAFDAALAVHPRWGWPAKRRWRCGRGSSGEGWGRARLCALCDAEQRASVTVGSRRQGWLGACVQWVQFRRLNRAWWDAYVVGDRRGR